MKKIIRFTYEDNVAVVLCDVKAGERMHLPDEEVQALEDIPYGHKIALAGMKKGDKVVKYGEPVARCTADIAKGSWVHIHNVESIRGLGR